MLGRTQGDGGFEFVLSPSNDVIEVRPASESRLKSRKLRLPVMLDVENGYRLEDVLITLTEGY